MRICCSSKWSGERKLYKLDVDLIFLGQPYQFQEPVHWVGR
jgi:hypothetical protein